MTNHPNRARYNGWANWQTWNVALWLGNDEGLYLSAKEYRKARGKLSAAAACELVHELMPNGTPDMRGDRSPYIGVRWGEIADAINEF